MTTERIATFERIAAALAASSLDLLERDIGVLRDRLRAWFDGAPEAADRSDLVRGLDAVAAMPEIHDDRRLLAALHLRLPVSGRTDSTALAIEQTLRRILSLALPGERRDGIARLAAAEAWPNLAGRGR